MVRIVETTRPASRLHDLRPIRRHRIQALSGDAMNIEGIFNRFNAQSVRGRETTYGQAFGCHVFRHMFKPDDFGICVGFRCYSGVL